MFDVLLLSMFN